MHIYSQSTSTFLTFWLILQSFWRLTSFKTSTIIAKSYSCFLIDVFRGQIFIPPLFFLSTAEQRVRLAANERKREYNEEQRNEYENYVEEDRDGEKWTHGFITVCFPKAGMSIKFMQQRRRKSNSTSLCHVARVNLSRFLRQNTRISTFTRRHGSSLHLEWTSQHPVDSAPCRGPEPFTLN